MKRFGGELYDSPRFSFFLPSNTLANSVVDPPVLTFVSIKKFDRESRAKGSRAFCRYLKEFGVDFCKVLLFFSRLGNGCPRMDGALGK